MITRDSNVGGEYIFSIFDGVQPKVTVAMEESAARILLALYVSFLQKRLGMILLLLYFLKVQVFKF